MDEVKAKQHQKHNPTWLQFQHPTDQLAQQPQKPQLAQK